MIPRVLAALAFADFRDRARRPAFLLVVLAAAGLGYVAAPPASTDYTMVKVGAFRGVYDSDYLGVMLAMIGSLWLPLFGFYAVKNAITRDTATGTGQLLAAAPLRKPTYLAGKFLSNFLVLAAMAGALALTAPAMQLLRGESTTVDLLALWLPFVLLCLPIVAVAAAAALLFESAGPLRGGLGNIVWFFAYAGLFVAGLSLGLGAVTDSFETDLAAQHPGVNTEISIGITGEEGGLRLFTWSGLEITRELIVPQLGYVALACLLALLPTLWFARFDPARQRQPVLSRTVEAMTTDASSVEPPAPAASPVASMDEGAFAQSALPRAQVVHGSPFRGLLAGELRVLLEGLSRWWWLGLAGLTVAALAVPADAVGTVLLFAWIWPALLWSRLGTQAREHDVHLLLGSGPSTRRRLLAEWAAGVALAAMTGAGPLGRMLVNGDTPAVAAWAAGALFIPTLAILLGSVSRSARLFQAVYLMLWYLLLNGAPAVDFMGAVRDGGQLAGPHPLLVLGVSAVLLTLAFANQEARHARR